MHIRKDVTFHNGRHMTGEDIKANLDRILDPKTGAIIRGELLIIDTIKMLEEKRLAPTRSEDLFLPSSHLLRLQDFSFVPH